MTRLTPERRSEITFENIALKDCGVTAVQAITGWRRRTAEARCKRHGYDPVAGSPRGTLEKTLRAHGYTCRYIFDDRRAGETVATFALKHEYGLYLVYVDGHVMALVEGDLHNSRGHWHDPVDAYTQVSR